MDEDLRVSRSPNVICLEGPEEASVVLMRQDSPGHMKHIRPADNPWSSRVLEGIDKAIWAVCEFPIQVKDAVSMAQQSCVDVSASRDDIASALESLVRVGVLVAGPDTEGARSAQPLPKRIDTSAKLLLKNVGTQRLGDNQIIFSKSISLQCHP